MVRVSQATSVPRGLPPARLRIAFDDGAAQGFELAAECAQALSETVDFLRNLGHEVRPASPSHDGAEMIRCLTTLLAAALAEEIPLIARDSGRQPGPSTVEACHLALMERGLRIGALELSRALQYRQPIRDFSPAAIIYTRVTVWCGERGGGLAPHPGS